MASTLIAVQSALTRAPVGSHGVRAAVRSTRSVQLMSGFGSRLQPQCASREVTFRGALSSSLAGESLWTHAGEARASATMTMGVYASNAISTETVRWCVAAACAALLLKRDAGARKQFWAGILALEAPRDWVAWARSEYGLWVACIGLALKLFYTIPAELDYPLAVYLLLVCAPGQALAQRGTVGAAAVSTALALFVAFQYFSNSVRLSDAFKGEHLLNTLLISFVALACIGFFGMTFL